MTPRKRVPPPPFYRRRWRELALAGAVLVLLTAVFLAGRHSKATVSPSDGPGGTFSVEEVSEDRPDQRLNVVNRIRWRTVDVARQGDAPGEAQGVVDSFVAAAIVAADSTVPDTLPPRALITEGTYQGGDLTLFLALSDGGLRRQEFKDVGRTFEFGAANGTGYVHSQRSIKKPVLIVTTLLGVAACLWKCKDAYDILAGR